MDSKVENRGENRPDSRSSSFGPSFEMNNVSEEIESLLENDEMTSRRSLTISSDSHSSSFRGLSSIYDEPEYPAPQVKFMAIFPERWEKKLQGFDDPLVSLCQKCKGKFVLIIDLIITALSAIETGIAAPFIMFILGWDGLATELSYLMLILSVVSQIPKRFLWRWRPYMVWRAFKLRKSETAVTSSFPSRAVTCATVYAYMIVYAYVYEEEKSSVVLITWWMPILIILAVLLSSFARINMGVHYPSDCVAGFFQGILVCVIGTLLWHADTLGCNSCFTDKCYSLENSETLISKDHLDRINFGAIGIGCLAGLLITIISVVKPVDFWQKCDRVYGMLFPGILFQVTFLCKRTTGSSLGHPDVCPWYGYFYALSFTGLATLVGFKNNGRYPVISFLVLFLFLFIGLVVWRVWVLPTVNIVP